LFPGMRFCLPSPAMLLTSERLWIAIHPNSSYRLVPKWCRIKIGSPFPSQDPLKNRKLQRPDFASIWGSPVVSSTIQRAQARWQPLGARSDAFMYFSRKPTYF